MLRKIFVVALMTMLLAGCGADKIVGTPDKAVLAYAQISMTGDSPNMQAAGFTDEDRNAIRKNLSNTFVTSMANITPMSDAAAEEITNIYFDRLKGAMNFKVTLAKDDSDRPVVEITTTPIDPAESARTVAAQNDELFALIGMVGKLKSEGADDAALKANDQVQALAVAALKNYIDNIKFAPEKTFSVPCAKVTGSDGNVHWAPADADAFVNFLTGR